MVNLEILIGCVNKMNSENSIFIFNDNIEHNKTNRTGGGNAIMRKYNKYSSLEIPKSAGIPTGSIRTGGFEKFNQNVKNIIDNAIDDIIELINLHKYTHLYYSAELTGEIGTSIFVVNEKVTEYITYKIFNLSVKPIQVIKQIEYQNNYFDDCDFEFDT